MDGMGFGMWPNWKSSETWPVTLEKVYPADGMDEIHFDFFWG